MREFFSQSNAMNDSESCGRGKGGREIELAAARSFTRSERHYDIGREGTRVKVDSDDLMLELLADLERHLEPVGAILELDMERIACGAKFGVELEPGARPRCDHRL